MIWTDAFFYMYVPDEGSLLPKYRDCTTSNDFELYIYIDIYTHTDSTPPRKDTGVFEGLGRFIIVLLD